MRAKVKEKVIMVAKTTKTMMTMTTKTMMMTTMHSINTNYSMMNQRMKTIPPKNHQPIKRKVLTHQADEADDQDQDQGVYKGIKVSFFGNEKKKYYKNTLKLTYFEFKHSILFTDRVRIHRAVAAAAAVVIRRIVRVGAQVVDAAVAAVGLVGLAIQDILDHVRDPILVRIHDTVVDKQMQ